LLYKGYLIMPIDPSIALGVKPIQFESPINQMAKMYELQNLQQTGQANQLAMQEKQRAIAEDEAVRNYFAQQDRTSPDFAKGLYGISPKTGQAYEKFQAETSKEKTLAKNAEIEQLTKIHGVLKTGATQVLANPTLANAIRVTQEVGRMTGSDVSADLAQLTELGENPEAIRRWAAGHALEADKLLPKFESQQNVMVNGVPTSRILSIDQLTNKASTLEGSAAPTYNKPAASTVVNVNNAQEKEFEKQLGKGQADKVLASKASAEDAAQILATNMVGKTLLDKGMLTGVGANFFTTLNQGLSQAGIDFGYADAAQNSQAYGALMAANTAKIIKQFGAGTGLSDADREYALKAAAGDIKMDEKAIRTILDINNRAAQNVINKHNKMVKTVEDKTKTILPYSVEVTDYTAGIPDGRAEASEKQSYKKVLDNLFPKSKK
jgi:hypothetical protein